MFVLRSLLLGLALAWLFHRLSVPGGPLIGAMIGAGVLAGWEGTPAIAVPGWLQFGLLAALGWTVGVGLTPTAIATVRASVGSITLVAGGLIVCGMIIAILLRRAGMDAPTAFLAAAPGGMAQMAAVSTDVGANAAVVAAAHLLRLVAVLLLAPFVLKALT